MVKPEIIEDYIEKVYGYAVNHTYTCDEADELSQEILLTVIRELPRLRDDSKFEPWLWGIANNVAKSFRRSMGKNRATYSYDVLENVPYEEFDEDETEELYDFLRNKISMLSEIYRNIIILYYYDGLSTKEIADKLNIPEGTQTGSVFRLKGKGIQYLRGSGRGDQYVTVRVVVPKNLTSEQKELLRKFSASVGETPAKENGHSSIFGKKKR